MRTKTQQSHFNSTLFRRRKEGVVYHLLLKNGSLKSKILLPPQTEYGRFHHIGRVEYDGRTPPFKCLANVFALLYRYGFGNWGQVKNYMDYHCSNFS